MDPDWSITEDHFNPKTARAYEGLFTTGSGYLHVRGSLEEHLSDTPQNITYTRKPANVTAEKFLEAKAKWGTYIPGVRGNHPLLNRGMVNLPFFIGISLFVGDEKLDIEQSQIENYQRNLYMASAILHRSFRWRTRLGATLEVIFERFVSAARPNLCIQKLEVSTDLDIHLTFSTWLDTDVRTSGHDHFTEVRFEPLDSNDIACQIRTDGGDSVHLCTKLISPVSEWIFQVRGRVAEQTTEFLIRAGDPLKIEKRTAVVSSFDQTPQNPRTILSGAAGLTYESLRAEHAQIWRRRWEMADVIIEGDAESQLEMRASLYHLLRAHPNDPRLAIDPKGYAGDAYRGCFFWDTEMYLFPFFLYTEPDRARSLLEYRIQSLAGARINAQQTNYRGARYAWEADIDGTETCPNWQYRDHEIHVTADVVYALAHFAIATGDAAFLTGPAREVILETGRYWLERLDWRKGEDHPSLLGVMGPDEYTPISNNNSYTNRMVSFALKLAGEVGLQTGNDPVECRAFMKAAAGLPILRNQERKIVLQCEDFERLADPYFDRLWKDRNRIFAAQVAQEWLYRSKCLKQADVLMLMMLYAQEFSDNEVRAAWDYYLPLTTHDSSLSAGVHAVIACRLGLMDKAWEFWKRGSGLDLDLEHGGAAEGIHIANAGMNWQVAVFGFAGLQTALQSKELVLNPRLPDLWARLAFPLVWRGAPLWIDIRPERIILENRSDRNIPARVQGKVLQISPGKNSWMIRP